MHCIVTTAGDAAKSLAAVESPWKKYNPEYTFDYNFLDSQFNDLYKSDIHVGQLFNYFAVLTILISCLGLFGLVTFTAESKLKEIGLRKVLGAGVGRIVGLLAQDFIKLVFIAIVIATPLAWFAMYKWLQAYAYHITIGWWVFVLAGLIAVIIAFATISFQSIKAAIANPVKSLRAE